MTVRSSGSGLFSKQHATLSHLLTHGVAKEVADLRQDISDELSSVAGIAVDEYTNPGASASNNLHAATATVAAPVTLLRAALVAGGLTILAAEPRNVIFTTAGVTPADAPATATITGTLWDGSTTTEIVTLAQTATSAAGVKLWKDITKIDYPAADGTAATIAVGVGKAMLLSKKPKTRAGATPILKEVAAGSVVTTGVLDATNHSYTPSTGQDGANDYAVMYEYDATA